MTRQHIYSHFCAFIYRFSVLNLSVCQASTITTLFFTSWKWLPFFWIVAQANGVLENEKSVMSFLKHWNMKRLKWLSLYFHINYHCFYFKVSASVNSVNTTVFSEGEDAILFCDVSGVPPPVVSWFNDKNENVYNGSLWKLPSVNRSYNGTYKCQASNGCGMDSKIFDIIVQCKSVGLWGTAHSLSFSVIDLFVVFRFGLKLKIVILGNSFLNTLGQIWVQVPDQISSLSFLVLQCC